MKKLSLIAFAYFLFLLSPFAQTKPMAEVVDDALTASVKQSLLMAENLSANDSLLPRSFVKGKLTTSNSKWWCSGFFPGVLWYLYEYNNDPKVLSYAKQYTARVEREKNNTKTHDLGFMLYCSFGNGLRITGDPEYKDVLLTGAKSLSTRFNPEVGLIKSWESTAGKWQYPVIIDNMMNLEFLLWASKASGDSFYKAVCISHADKTIKYHYRPDFSCYHVVSYDTISGFPEKKQTHQGFSDESSWSRGQAWGLYGYTMMYRETKDKKYLLQAQNIANYLLNHPHMPKDLIPYWDFDAPNIPDAPRDASAGALIASALIELSQYVTKSLAQKYLSAATLEIRTLASPEYTAGPGENGNFILKHGVGSFPHHSEVGVPLTYADYYFVEALMRYKKIVLKK